MKIIGKIIALPFILALTILVAVLNFLTSVSTGILSVIASLFALMGVITLFTAGGNDYLIRTAIAGLVLAFVISPFGLPALAGWITDLLDSLNDTLKGFVTG